MKILTCDQSVEKVSNRWDSVTESRYLCHATNEQLVPISILYLRYSSLTRMTEESVGQAINLDLSVGKVVRENIIDIKLNSEYCTTGERILIIRA